MNDTLHNFAAGAFVYAVPAVVMAYQQIKHGAPPVATIAVYAAGAIGAGIVTVVMLALWRAR